MAATIRDLSEVTTVQAGGGVVCRPGPADLIEVVLVHRPAYDDWTLPKGKVDPGETVEQAALREVEEETGLRCRLLEPLGCTEYRDRRGRHKTVCYWMMEPLDGGFTPTEEIDQLRWLTLEEASQLLTYERDGDLLAALPVEEVALLLSHDGTGPELL